MGLSSSPATYSHGTSIKLSYLSFSLSYRAERSGHLLCLLLQETTSQLKGPSFAFLMVSEASVCHGWEAVAEESSSYHGNQEAEEKNTRRGQDKT